MYATFVMEIVDYIDCFSLLNEEKFNNFYLQKLLVHYAAKEICYFSISV
jgi:hypothetical protein